MPEDAAATSAELATVRAHRIRLREASQALEAALAAPLTGRPDGWVGQVMPAVQRIREAFAAHVSFTEGRGGLFDQIRTDAPRLVTALARLHREHDEITAGLAAAEEQLEARGEAGMARVREQLTAALTALSLHRKRGADLLYEAYQVDLGGE
jgi:Hemerythrin HHE cation binding domain